MSGEELTVFVAPVGTPIDAAEFWRPVGTIDSGSLPFGSWVLGELAGTGEHPARVTTASMTFELLLLPRGDT